MHTQTLRDAIGLNQDLRSRRKELGLTQQELGQRAGLAAKHISRIENGTHGNGGAKLGHGSGGIVSLRAE